MQEQQRSDWPYTPGEKLQPRRPRRRSRRTIMTGITVVVVFFIFALFTLNWLQGDTVSENLSSKTFAVDAQAHLIVHQASGLLRIQSGGSGSEIIVHPVLKKRGLWMGSHPTVSYSTPSSNTVQVDVSGSTGMGLNIDTAELDITVPNTLALDLHLDSGDLEIKGVTLSDHGTISSNMGKISFEGKLAPQAHYSITNNAGELSVTLPADSALHVSAQVNTGNVSSDFSELKVERKNFTGASTDGDLNGGGSDTKLILTDNSGSLEIKKAS
ncbi:DUF4097 family beta strand repeat-containing protein [Tengunoibacter tsumagoiensis]|uniref:DUF4097 domain-containing protein n=1 Tax=Tengunoibacter tsumagoiensis TaxID=2014871 RepID=A0A401ZWU5_9CHLR|nr:DUF4097 family beta strand repeat-containing protein [Tengunoibacter tsumagoiensis]GCE11282.1 hypothetical protein KTT_11410 [Tengunoibacter tsumagoiensis]